MRSVAIIFYTIASLSRKTVLYIHVY